jgi:hypothetical protein
MIFGSFNLRKEFFAKHQLNYLADIVRVLFYSGLKFNFYDVLVMAMDERVNPRLTASRNSCVLSSVCAYFTSRATTWRLHSGAGYRLLSCKRSRAPR